MYTFAHLYPPDVGTNLQATVFHAGIDMDHELATQTLEASLQNLVHKRGNEDCYAATSADNARGLVCSWE